MANVICAKCNLNVSDETGYCPECGDSFKDDQTEPASTTADAAETAQPKSIVTTPLDIILQSLNSIGAEVKGLQERVDGISRIVSSPSTSEENTQKMLAGLSAKVETLASVLSAMKAASQTEAPPPKKKELLAAFYKTLNSPNSMFEYMFYLCIVQTVFVVVILFLAAYIVTLVKS